MKRKTCPKCGDRSTKIINISTGYVECQRCKHLYREPEKASSNNKYTATSSTTPKSE